MPRARGKRYVCLTEAVREANDYLYHVNANAPFEIRRYAGVTAAVLRDDEIFVRAGGVPG